MRFQGGTIFPLAVAAVLVLGLALITYARASRPDADDSPPQPGVDHWHWAYGFQLCRDEPNLIFAGSREQFDSAGNIVGDEDFIRTGVHSHDDGVIHWHPYTVVASGNRARLGLFLENYGVELSDTKLEFTENNLVYQETKAPVAEDFPLVYEEGETECDGEDAVLKVVKWTDYDDPSSDQQYVADFNNIRIDGPNQAIVFAFVPADVDVEMPPWSANLIELGALDSATPPNDSGVVPLASEPAAAVGTSVPDSVADSVPPDSVSPESVPPESSGPPTTG